MHRKQIIRGHPGNRRRSGFTLIEVMVCAVMLAIAISGFIGSLVACFGVTRINHDTTVARQAAQQVLEQIQGRTFSEVFRAYNANAGDDAGLVTPAVGPNFAVAGLEVLPTDLDGMCGEVQFPVITAGGVQTLNESVVDKGLGMPSDLNADGKIDNADHSADYKVLPVRIRVQWRSTIGPRHIELTTVLCQR